MIPLGPSPSLNYFLGQPLGHRFAVFFLGAGVVPYPLDVRFQKVSGLETSVETANLNEGGQNLYSHTLPKRVSHGKLQLERGFVVGSLLNLDINAQLSLFKFAPANVIVAVLGESGVPLAAWTFAKAFPVRWSTADLNAGEDKVLIDTLELAYAHMQAIRI